MFQHSLRDMIGGIRAHAEAEAAYVQNAVVPAVRKEAKAPDPRMKVSLSARPGGTVQGWGGIWASPRSPRSFSASVYESNISPSDRRT